MALDSAATIAYISGEDEKGNAMTDRTEKLRSLLNAANEAEYDFNKACEPKYGLDGKWGFYRAAERGDPEPMEEIWDNTQKN